MSNVYCVLDTETTGLTDDHELIEFTMIEVNPVTLVTGTQFQGKVAPQFPSRTDPRALKVNGIKYEDMIDYPSDTLIRSEFIGWWEDALGGRPIIPIAHNWAFDSRFFRKFLQYQMEDMFHKNRYIDTKATLETLKIIGKICSHRNPEEFSTHLDDLTSAWGIAHDPHKSYEDCHATLDVLRYLKETLPNFSLEG